MMLHRCVHCIMGVSMSSSVLCSDGVSTLATGSPMGHIAVWDLEERKLASMQRRAHRGAVTGLQFMAEQPLMVTSSADNSVKVRD